ncbi:unnamed protein product [Meloidogyne enterolobii]|uniref:Uncharacterized protein n=1 Tax=Meloidogyne enterolobii TaxID=390850 RepID=A0ACB1B5I6_MELEN
MEKSEKLDKPLIDINNNNKNPNPRKISRTQQKPIFHTQLSDQQNGTQIFSILLTLLTRFSFYSPFHE